MWTLAFNNRFMLLCNNIAPYYITCKAIQTDTIVLFLLRTCCMCLLSLINDVISSFIHRHVTTLHIPTHHTLSHTLHTLTHTTHSHTHYTHSHTHYTLSHSHYTLTHTLHTIHTLTHTTHYTLPHTLHTHTHYTLHTPTHYTLSHTLHTLSHTLHTLPHTTHSLTHTTHSPTHYTLPHTLHTLSHTLHTLTHTTHSHTHYTLHTPTHTDVIDIVNDHLSSSDYKKEEDPSHFVSKKNGRGPLQENWITSPPGGIIMCSYKLIKVLGVGGRECFVLGPCHASSLISIPWIGNKYGSHFQFRSWPGMWTSMALISSGRTLVLWSASSSS